MSPELIAPRRFGLEDSRPTKPSDYYALGMVIYETIGGHPPFHKDADLTVFLKVVEGEHPPRGAGFPEDLWKMLEWCWTPKPNDSPNIEDVLLRLGLVSRLSEPPFPCADEGMDRADDDLDSTTGASRVPNWASCTTTTEWSTVMPPTLDHLANSPPSPSIIKAISDADVDSLGRGVTDLDLSVSPIDSDGAPPVNPPSTVPNPLSLANCPERSPDVNLEHLPVSRCPFSPTAENTYRRHSQESRASLPPRHRATYFRNRI